MQEEFLSELQTAQLLPGTAEQVIFKGAYPRLYARNIEPQDFYPDYIQTYLERDVRNMKKVGDLLLFKTFVKLCAGRVGQLLNISSIANDCGILVPTAKS